MIAREDAITQSLQDHLREHLYGTFSYPSAKVEIIDGFDLTLFDERYGDSGLDKTFIATAYQFDDGGRSLELGSTLTEYLHTIDFIILGHTSTWGRNVAHVVKAIFLTDEGSVPLYDFSVAVAPRPVLDRMPVEEVSAQREFSMTPRPWNAHAWTTRVRLTDTVFATT
jgi:hypothetical protein